MERANNLTMASPDSWEKLEEIRQILQKCWEMELDWILLPESLKKCEDIIAVRCLGISVYMHNKSASSIHLQGYLCLRKINFAATYKPPQGYLKVLGDRY